MNQTDLIFVARPSAILLFASSLPLLSIDVCSRLSGKNHMLVIEMHVIRYAYTCIMQRRTIVVNSHNEKK